MASPVRTPARRSWRAEPAAVPAPGLAAPRAAAVRAARRPAAATDAGSEFVVWPGAAAWPPFESGELIRVKVELENGIVEAEVLVGQDGFARAVRLVE